MDNYSLVVGGWSIVAEDNHLEIFLAISEDRWYSKIGFERR